jgi:hypothetical protein
MFTAEAQGACPWIARAGTGFASSARRPLLRADKRTSDEAHAVVITLNKALPVLTAWIQGAYYAAFGIWPIISIDTFQAVTGPKTDHLSTGFQADHWLVNTVGLLLVAIGVTLLMAGWRRNVVAEIFVLGIGSAFGLAAIDVIYVARGTIPTIYLADAIIEGTLILAWIGSLWVRQL